MVEPSLDMIPEMDKEVWMRQFRYTNEYAESVKLPPSWKEIRFTPDDPIYGARGYVKGNYQRGGLKVLLDVSDIWGGKLWLHLSCSRKDRMPTYEDLAEMKAVFAGPGRQAVQVFPVKKKHINLHPFCLHLWCCLDPAGDGLPDFGEYGTI